MTVGPCIVFTRFTTGDSPKLVPWVDHLQRVANRTQTELSDDDSFAQGAVVWHLLSANNRQLARSAKIHSSVDAAAAGARLVVEACASLIVEMVSEQVRGGYGWFARDQSEPVLVCSRWYDTSRDRSHASDLAIRSLSEAWFHPGARIVSPALVKGVAEPAFR